MAIHLNWPEIGVKCPPAFPSNLPISLFPMRILSGLQPSGRLHIGNYFGMMQGALKLQYEGEAYYFIADYHSLTSIQDRKKLREHVRDLAIDFLACGLDPEKCVLFRQSDIPEHCELMWILSTVTPMGLLERCHSYKDKVANGIPASHGLFAYPVLMAADILIYEADVVPVGKDQKQHVEVTRDIAIKMNEAFGEGLLKMPQPRIRDETAVVPGLDGQKMSKSYDNTIQLFEEPAALKKKIMGIKTDSTPVEAPKPMASATSFWPWSRRLRAWARVTSTGPSGAAAGASSSTGFSVASCFSSATLAWSCFSSATLTRAFRRSASCSLALRASSRSAVSSSDVLPS